MLHSTAPLYTTIIASTLGEIDILLRSYVFQGYEALSQALSTPVLLISTVYIVILGFGIMMGWIKMSVSNFTKAVLKIGFVTTAVLNWSFVSEYIVSFINNAVGDLSSALISISPIPIPGAENIDVAMQVVLDAFTKIGFTLTKAGGISNLKALLDGWVILGFGWFMMGITLFEIILAKVMLAILFTFTPLMVLFCYFKPLQPIFDRWLGAIVGFALLQLFVNATLALALSLVYDWLGIHTMDSALQIGSHGVLPIIILGIVSVGLILKAAHLAQNLGGVVSGASGAAMVGGIVGGAVGGALGAAKAAGNLLKPPIKNAKDTVKSAAKSVAEYAADSLVSGVKSLARKARGTEGD